MKKNSGHPPRNAKVSDGNAVVPVAASRPPSISNDPAVVREPGVTMVVGQPYAAGDITIIADAVFHVDGAKPRSAGPWLGEADKIAWRDPETGYECIVMRDTDRGHLSGYVGIPTSHPLYGFEHDAVPAEIGIEVHGGLSYSRICDGGPAPDRRRLADEARRICHAPPPPGRYAPLQNATDHEVHADAWWFGFSCDRLYDIVPGDAGGSRRFLTAETGPVYRDEAYVMREVQNLTRQLRAIADGLSVPPREGAPLSPIGLNPDQED